MTDIRAEFDAWWPSVGQTIGERAAYLAYQAAAEVRDRRIKVLEARIKKEQECVHIFGDDGDGSSCYCCGMPNPRHERQAVRGEE
jgi:hypothetical protein